MSKKPIFLKCKASALPSVITISVIILILISGLITLSSYINGRYYHNIKLEQLERNSISAMNILLADSSHLLKQSHIDLYGHRIDSVILNKYPWGIYDMLQVIAFRGKDSIQKMALAASIRSSKDMFALYLADKHLPLSISGKTWIRGPLYIPEAEIRKSLIEGRSLDIDTPIQGDIMQSKETLPPLNSQVLKSIQSQFLHDSVLHSPLPDSTVSNLSHGFDHPVHVIVSKKPMKIDQVDLRGNIKIICDSGLRITSGAYLENIQIYARSVYIDQGFRGALQIFALDSIHIGPDVELEYPSVLGLLSKDGEHMDGNPMIVLSNKSKIHGFVFSTWPDKDKLYPLIQVDSATINGQLYSAGMLQLRGKVAGSTLTQGFILHTPSTTYENYVLDGIMDQQALSPYQLGNNLLNKDPIKKILKWL